MNSFESSLRQHDAADWAHARTQLRPSIHEVDRNATDIWFHFFPQSLSDAFERTDNPARLLQELRLEGRYRLADQSDGSHWFLYGHRYWPQARALLIERAESSASPSNDDLAATIRDLAGKAASAARVDESLVAGITTVALNTLQQIGLAAFKQGSGAVQMPPLMTRKTPAQLLAARKRNDSQGIMGLLRGLKSRFTVRFDERDDAACFPAINQQHLTTASANDTRDYSSGSRPCHEGPIPVQCRTASCGTCWVGVLGGAESLSDVDAHEARRMKEFGYIDSTEPKPIIRLACMALVSGNATIVIPPWNGFLGKAGLGERKAG